MGLDAEYCARISLASQLHDIGKIGVPDLILNKRGTLDASEWQVMKTHCALGARMLAQNSSPYLRMAAEIARSHHERWDGSGYPDGLAGEAIPRAARITRLCDTYDALRSYRPYKREVDHDLAVRAIMGGNSRSRPLYFDPAVLAAFESGHDAFRDIFATVRE
jgi:putative two-component system response regulator